MAASYPSGFDTMSDPAANLSGPPLHSTMHLQLNDVIEAIEAELGLTPSGADATVAASITLLRAAAVPTAWTAVTYTNSWVDNGGADQVVQYRKVGDNVQIRGMMKNGTLAASAFTLPAGFRPPATLNFASMANNAFADFSISSAGLVVPQIGSNVFYAVNCIFSVT